MKKEDKTNQNRHKVEKEEKFTLDQVQSLSALIAAGILGIGGQECIDEAEKLPEELKKVLIATTMAARDCMMAQVPGMLASVLAKAGKLKNN